MTMLLMNVFGPYDNGDFVSVAFAPDNSFLIIGTSAG
jgi:hypothetical protein